MEMAEKRAQMQRMGLLLTKQAINHVEDLQGKRNGMEAAFAWHHFSHAHNDLTTGNVLSGFDAKKMADSQRTKKKTPKKKRGSGPETTSGTQCARKGYFVFDAPIESPMCLLGQVLRNIHPTLLSLAQVAAAFTRRG